MTEVVSMSLTELRTGIGVEMESIRLHGKDKSNSKPNKLSFVALKCVADMIPTIPYLRHQPYIALYSTPSMRDTNQLGANQELQ